MKAAFAILLTLAIYSETCLKNPGTEINGRIEFIIDSLAIREQDLFAPFSLIRFYREREFEPAWVHQADIDSLRGILSSATEFGLIPSRYLTGKIDSVSRITSLESDLLLDILLTDSYFKFLHHVKGGWLDRTTERPLEREYSTDSTVVNALTFGLRDHSLRAEILKREPKQAGYAALRQALSRRVRESLAHRANAPVDSALVTMAINLERWRREAAFPARYLLINIPSFDLWVVENDQVQLYSRVIVGLSDKQTPTLTSRIECIIIYPYWHVPRSIATKELLPLIQADPGYLRAHRFEVLDAAGNVVDASAIKWSMYNEKTLPFRLRQREGSDNALGIIKFQFDNPYGVYLHDTNAPYLFRKEMRALSHGCIRAEEARLLAHYIVRYDSAALQEEQLDRMLNSRQRREISIRKPLPIMVRYFTADQQNIYDDIYNQDTKLLSAFSGFARNDATGISIAQGGAPVSKISYQSPKTRR